MENFEFAIMIYSAITAIIFIIIGIVGYVKKRENNTASAQYLIVALILILISVYLFIII